MLMAGRVHPLRHRAARRVRLRVVAGQVMRSTRVSEISSTNDVPRSLLRPQRLASPTKGHLSNPSAPGTHHGRGSELLELLKQGRRRR